jgi:hypothetical protein
MLSIHLYSFATVYRNRTAATHTHLVNIGIRIWLWSAWKSASAKVFASSLPMAPLPLS